MIDYLLFSIDYWEEGSLVKNNEVGQLMIDYLGLGVRL